MEADKDGDGKLSFEEFTMMVSNTVRNILEHILATKYTMLTIGWLVGHRETNDSRRSLLTIFFCYVYHTWAAAPPMPFKYDSLLSESEDRIDYGTVVIKVIRQSTTWYMTAHSKFVAGMLTSLL